MSYIKSEVTSKYGRDFTKQKYIAGLKEILGDVKQTYGNLSMLDGMKMDFLLDNIDKISLEQLESLIK